MPRIEAFIRVLNLKGKSENPLTDGDGLESGCQSSEMTQLSRINV